MIIYRVEYLPWDSEFFQIKTGKIILDESGLQPLEEAFQVAKVRGYQLIYVLTASDFAFPDSFLHKWDGILADQKVTFSCADMTTGKLVNQVEIIPVNSTQVDIGQLKELALVSGQYSRFKIDKNFPEGSFERLYHTWIEKSVNREIASEVCVIRLLGKIRGMMTIAYMVGKVVIGLIAVSPEVQGKGVGTDLLNFIKEECQKKSISCIEVTTQQYNQSACLFYKRNNFVIFRKQNIFHFWLQ